MEEWVRIEHVAIWCRDLEAQRAFYETYFCAKSSAKYVNKDKGFESYFLRLDSGARLELMRVQTMPELAGDRCVPSVGLAHLAFSGGSEARVDALTHALERAGHRVLHRPRRTGDGYYESVVLDPENNCIELTV
jgi:lactoylglutathione lyase